MRKLLFNLPRVCGTKIQKLPLWYLQFYACTANELTTGKSGKEIIIAPLQAARLSLPGMDKDPYIPIQW